MPHVKRAHLLIETSRTLISAGTERALVEFGQAGWLAKARQQPEKLRMVMDKIRTDGLMPTLEAVLSKLNQPLPLGYCNVGRVVEVGVGGETFVVGDRVVSNGRHAEAVNSPVNLCARIPDVVSDDEAAFTVLGAIALQGIRLVQPGLGETVVVMGLGLVGQLTVQLLRASGCRVLGIDFDPGKLEVARQFGVEVVDLAAGQDPVNAADIFSRNRGVDAVIVTASTRSSKPLHQAALMSRKRGRIVLVGVTGLELSRSDFYEKELVFQVSCSYGPGRYDPNYEVKGNDYPLGFVRWTAQRNFEAVLDMMSDGRLNVNPLISHRFPITEAERAYELIAGNESSLGVLLRYPGIDLTPESQTIAIQPVLSAARSLPAAISFIGSGNYALATLIPAFKAVGVRLRSVVSKDGVSGVHAGRKFGFEEATTDAERVLSDPQTTAVAIGTRHDSHARYVLQSLAAGKHVFVEKPLCLTLDELTEIEAAYVSLATRSISPPVLMVGFNRRFSPQVQRIKQLLLGVTGPKAIVVTVNAGSIPADHWTQDKDIGGGRVIGEACHFIDLLRYLAGVVIVDHRSNAMETTTGDTLTLQLHFADGSIGTIHYFSNGSKSFPKERLEVFAEGRVLQLDNFRRLTGYGWPGFRTMNLWRQDKGHQACVRAFIEAVEGKGAPPIPFHELIEVSRIAIESSAHQA